MNRITFDGIPLENAKRYTIKDVPQWTLSSEVDITRFGSPFAEKIQTVDVRTRRGTLTCDWSTGAFQSAYVHGRIDVDELEVLVAAVLRWPHLP